MSFENEINSSVKGMVESIKNTVMENIVHVVRKGDLTIDENKLPGLDKIIRESVDQAFANSSFVFLKVVSKYSEKLKNDK